MTPPALRIEYLSGMKAYQLLRCKQDSQNVVSYAFSSIELIKRMTTFLRRNLKESYVLSYSPVAWQRLSVQERSVLEGILDLHAQVVDQEKR